MLREIPPQMDVGLDMEEPVGNAFLKYDEKVEVVQCDFDNFHDAPSNHDHAATSEDVELDII